MYRLFGKRLLDFVVAAVLFATLSPLLVVLALTVRVKLGGPVLFRQVRAGMGGRSFVLYKFRSMTDGVDDDGVLLPDEQRLTGFGRWLRATSLDELPQIFNVLRGEMSLAGPRPLLPEYNKHYSAEQKRRLEVRPGITGWSQVRGRNTVSWPQRLADDVWYVDHCGPLVDLYIFGLTLLRLVRPTGINAEGHATMPSFLDEPVSQERAA